MLTIATRIFFLALGAAFPAIADAQPLGTFFWRMEPYCNVLTLEVVREGQTFRVQGTDDWCNAGPLPVRGTAVVGRTCLLISDPEAKLLVEYNRRNASGIGPNVLSTISVYYADQGTGLQTPGLTNDVWCIRLERENAVMPFNATFTVQVLP